MFSGNVALSTIPRATTPSVPALTMGTQDAIDLSSRASSSFTHTLRYAFGNSSGTITTKTSATSVPWTPGIDLAAQVPGAVSGIGTLTCDTYSGDTLVGSKSINYTLFVPSSVVPSISNMVVAKQSANYRRTGLGRARKRVFSREADGHGSRRIRQHDIILLFCGQKGLRCCFWHNAGRERMDLRPVF